MAKFEASVAYMKFYSCPTCAARIFFENLQCLQCGSLLAYDPAQRTMVKLDDDQPSQVCGNREGLQCNWLVDAAQDVPVIAAQEPSTDETTHQQPLVLCACCAYTRTIPPQTDAENRLSLFKLEQAKRYLFYSLLELQLPTPARTTDPDKGLAFDFLVQQPGQAAVMTGHADGVITINASEADDAQREQRRVVLNEPYRTVLGHLRHEVGHFYWDTLVANSEFLQPFRELFGDEQVDYQAALRAHYARSDTNQWRDEYISYYASAHPWEDWAESWAHYLHIFDALDTAHAWRIGLLDMAEAEDHAPEFDSLVGLSDSAFRETLIKKWLPLSQYLNASCRSLGEPDAYPFVMPARVIDKLAFIHRLIAHTAASAND